MRGLCPGPSLASLAYSSRPASLALSVYVSSLDASLAGHASTIHVQGRMTGPLDAGPCWPLCGPSLAHGDRAAQTGPRGDKGRPGPSLASHRAMLQRAVILAIVE